MVSTNLLQFVRLIVLFGMIGGAASDTLAQKHQGSPSRLAADVVFLQEGHVYYGVVFSRDEQHVRLVMNRDWFKRNDPRRYAEHHRDEKRLVAAARKSLLKRIGDWQADRRDEEELVHYLEELKQRVKERSGEEPPQPRFTIVPLSRNEIRRIVVQAPDRRQLALLGWKHQLDDVSVRPASELERQLKKLGVDVENETVDFSKEVPLRTQSDFEWAMRRSIVEYEMREPLEFQGMGEKFLRKGENNQLLDIIQMSLGGGRQSMIQQVGEELGLPEFTRNRKPHSAQRESREDWWKAMSDIAEQDGFRSFTATRLQQSLLSPTVKVKIFLFAQDHRGNWHIAYSSEATANANEATPDQMEALREDPRIQDALALLEQLGVGNSNRVEQALRHGYATQAAFGDAIMALSEYTGHFLGRLDFPPIR